LERLPLRIKMISEKNMEAYRNIILNSRNEIMEHMNDMEDEVMD
jgi:hypothetical protein